MRTSSICSKFRLAFIFSLTLVRKAAEVDSRVLKGGESIEEVEGKITLTLKRRVRDAVGQLPDAFEKTIFSHTFHLTWPPSRRWRAFLDSLGVNVSINTPMRGAFVAIFPNRVKLGPSQTEKAPSVMQWTE